MSNRVGSLYWEVLINGAGFEAGRKKITAGARELTSYLKQQQVQHVADIDLMHKKRERLIEASRVMFKDDADKQKAIEAGITRDFQLQLEQREALRVKALREARAAAGQARAEEKLAQDKRNIDERKANEKAKESWAAYTNSRLQQSKKLAQKEEELSKYLIKVKFESLQKEKEIFRERRELEGYLAKVKFNSLQEEKRIQRENEELTQRKLRDGAKARADAKLTADTRVIEERKANEKAKAAWAEWANNRAAANAKEVATVRSHAAYLARVRIASARMEAQRLEQIELQRQQRMEAIRRRDARNSIFGEGGWMSRSVGMVGRLTFALFPLYAAWMAVSRAITMAKDSFMAFINAADEKKLQTLRLAALNDGDVAIAKSLRKEMVAYAKATSFSVKETMELAVRVRALGVATGDISSVIQVFGRLSLGNSSVMSRLVKAYTDVVGMGKLMQTEVKQFAQAGINIRKYLMEVLELNGDSAKLNEMIKGGLVSAADVQKALKLAYENYGPLELAQLETFSGQWAVMAEGFDEFLANVGNSDSLVRFMKDLNAVLDIVYGMIQAIAKSETAWNAAMISMRMEVALLTLGVSELVYGLAQLAAMGGSLALTGSADYERSLRTWLDAARYASSAGGELGIGDFGSGKVTEEDKVRSREILLSEQELLEIKREQTAAQHEAARGRKLELEQLEQRNSLNEAYNESMKRTAGSYDIEARKMMANKAMYEEYIGLLSQATAARDNIDAKIKDRNTQRLEKALQTSMPSEMRQNSVEEWVYLKSKRDEAEREQREENRWQKQQDNERNNAQLVVDGLNSTLTDLMSNNNPDTTSGI